MSDGIENRANKVVDLFKQALSAEAQKILSSKDYERLTGLVKSVLSEQRDETIEQLEEYIRKLRAEVEHRDIDL
jgi:hypothetical protein